MKYVMTFGPGQRSPRPRLDDGTTRAAVATECREAALSFMTGVAAGWDKLDLALWLTGPYARAARHGRNVERVAASYRAELISDESIEKLVTRVRGQLLASLEKAALDAGSLEFAREVLDRGLVRRAVGADGCDVWIPVDSARLRLRDRLRSLFVADYLCAPSSYTELFVCHRCEAVVFDAHAKQNGVCGAHRLSGMVPRDGAPALRRSGSEPD